MNTIQKPIRDWTVLVYQGNGCYGKFGTHQQDLRELENLSTGDRVAILTQGHKDCNRPLLERREFAQAFGNKIVSEVGGRQSEPESLADFVRWGMDEYPSKYTCLIISGFAGGSNGMIVDEKTGLTPLTDIRKGLRCGLDGRKLDVLAFDGHWMACIEAAAEFKDTANLMVASQGRMESWDYTVQLNQLVANPDTQDDDLAQQMLCADTEDSGMTIYNLSETEPVLAWTGALCEATQGYGLGSDQIDNSESIWHFKDLQDFTKEFSKDGMPVGVGEIAQELSIAIDNLVVQHRPMRHWNSSGVSVAYSYEDRVDGKAFREATGWDHLIARRHR